MIANIHYGSLGRVVTICDKELLGKEFIEGKLKLTITKRFYEGQEKTEKELLSMIQDEDVLNIVGEKSIAFAIKNNFVQKENVKTIQGIPHAQSC